jgi:hypothetical protein
MEVTGGDSRVDAGSTVRHQEAAAAMNPHVTLAVGSSVLDHRAAAVAMSAHATFSVGATVQAIADAIDPTRVTLTDLQKLAAILTHAARTAVPANRVADRVEQQPLFGAVGRFIRANGSLITLIALVVSVMALLQERAADARTDPPPSVTVQIAPPDRAEIERIVDERLREIEAHDALQGRLPNIVDHN